MISISRLREILFAKTKLKSKFFEKISFEQPFRVRIHIVISLSATTLRCEILIFIFRNKIPNEVSLKIEDRTDIII